jgi:hypothetical protein
MYTLPPARRCSGLVYKIVSTASRTWTSRRRPTMRDDGERKQAAWQGEPPALARSGRAIAAMCFLFFGELLGAECSGLSVRAARCGHRRSARESHNVAAATFLLVLRRERQHTLGDPGCSRWMRGENSSRRPAQERLSSSAAKRGLLAACEALAGRLWHGNDDPAAPGRGARLRKSRGPDSAGTFAPRRPGHSTRARGRALRRGSYRRSRRRPGGRSASGPRSSPAPAAPRAGRRCSAGKRP